MSENSSTYKGIYAMHKYWGKKPFNVVSKFIEKYSEPNEWVLDSFCGSGVTVIEALKLNRKCVGADLNPIAIKLSKACVTAVNIEEINKCFEEIKCKLQKKIYSLYEMIYDNENTLVTHTIWKNDEPVEVWYETSRIRKNIRAGTETDKLMCNKPHIAPLWYPENVMLENSRINIEKGEKVSDLFTQRALSGLSLLFDEIQKIPDEDIRTVFELTFSGTLSQASNLVFVIRRRKNKKNNTEKAEVGSWVIGYWVPEEHFEINVWNCFENRFKRIIKGEKEISEIFSDKPVDYYNENVKLFNCSATDLPLDDNSIDYVFIDPPHANRIMYMEQSFMWNAWLKLDSDINWDDEVIISEAADRKNKDSDNYNELLGQAFSEIQRVLKPQRFFSLAFNCLDDNTWLNMLNLLVRYGFEIHDIIPLEYSATSVIQDNRKNALKNDFVLTFKNSESKNISSIVFNEDEILLEEMITEIINNQEGSEVHNVMNELFSKTIPLGYIFKISSIIKKCAEML